jgi:hypothetical protein
MAIHLTYNAVSLRVGEKPVRCRCSLAVRAPRMVKNFKRIEKAWFPVSQFFPTAGF